MIRSFTTRHYRTVFFLALYLVYLVVLFGVSGVRDPGEPDRIIARLATSAIELSLCGLLCAACMRMARRSQRWPWTLLAATIALVAAIAYLAQVYSLYVSDNFISALALQNSDSAAFVQSRSLKLGAVAMLLWVGWFCAASVMAASTPADAQRGMAERWRSLPFAAITLVMALLFVYSILLQDKNMRLEPGFRQAPMANLLANLYRAKFAPGLEPETAQVEQQSNLQCFDYGSDPDTGDYPFQRAEAYRDPLPLPSRGAGTESPNIVVIFTEGTSSRLIGAYGGRYPQLTPNIDRLAGQSMRVDDYFNHTAATYRGLTGQLSSGFSYAGGAGKGGWTKPGTMAGLSSIRRQTLPRIANAAGYDSYFFAPHKTQRPIIVMLRSLGFEKVFAYESISRLLHGRVAARPATGALDDSSLFRGLVQFLRQRQAAADDKPFFIATYNIGTHAFLDSSEHDLAYADGDNAVLDKLHNYDSALGGFLDYFYSSPYADNTILVFTSDHATYPEAAFRDVAGADLKPYFVDRIPLLIRDPTHRLPATFDAQGRNSLDLAPTVLQLAGLQTRSNSFLGRSIFEPRNFPTGVAATASQYFMTTPGGVFGQTEIPQQWRATFECEINVVRRFYRAESANRIFEPMQAGVVETVAGKRG